MTSGGQLVSERGEADPREVDLLALPRWAGAALPARRGTRPPPTR